VTLCGRDLRENRPQDLFAAADGISIVEAVAPGQAVLTAEVRPEAADRVLAAVANRGVPGEDVTLVRLDDVGPIRPGHAAVGLIWADVLGQATRNARPVARYLVFMVTAGVIAAFGVIEVNEILIVGAMAVSPDLLPITAAGVAVVTRDARLLGRALVTLTAGMAAAGLAAAASTAVQNLLGVVHDDFQIDNSLLHGLDTVGWATITVALFAGIAGMLSLETRASSGVGVAISATTIPAAAYLGIAAALGEVPEAIGGLGVLVTNITMLVVGASLTLAVQRALRRRQATAPPPR
jgi:uncharacterized hydrophobic protein (TIGR00271 family)